MVGNVSDGQNWSIVKRGGWSAACVVVGTFLLIVAVLAGWADRTLFNSGEFADRAVVVLRDGRVRQELGEAIADQLEAAGVSDVVAYRSELLPIIVDVVGTPGFEAIFRRAVETAHRAAVSQHAGTAALELGETIEIFASSAAAAGNPGLAQTLERRAGSLLIDAGPVLARLDLYRLSERVRWLDDVAGALTVIAFAAAVLLDRDRRRSVRRIGAGAVVAGLVVVVVTLLAPRIAAREIDDPTLAAAVSGAVGRFIADLLTIGLWVMVAGVLLAAAAEAAGVPRPHVTERAGAAWRWVESSPRRQAVGGIVLLLVAALLIVAREAVVALVLVSAGIALAYVGAVLCITAAFGASPAHRPAAHPVSRRAVGIAAAVVLVAVVAVGAVLTVGAARSDARASRQLECNGSADLCDRRLDQVALAGAHNAMSAATNPGWLFPEQLTGIPAQLEYGVRALLVKTHYGTPTGVEVGGAEIVVTNVAAESSVDRSDEVSELSAEAVARAQQLEQTVPVQAAERTIYLCHVYCSLGAIPFSDVLAQLKAFMDRNPHEVILLFIGDYVSPEDTAAAFAECRPHRPRLDLRHGRAAPDTAPDDRGPPDAARAVRARRWHAPVVHPGLRHLPGDAVHVHLPGCLQLPAQPRTSRCTAVRAEPLHHHERGTVDRHSSPGQRLRRPRRAGAPMRRRAPPDAEHRGRQLRHRGRLARGGRKPQ